MIRILILTHLFFLIGTSTYSQVKEDYITINGTKHFVKEVKHKGHINKQPLIIIHGGPGGNNYNYEVTIGKKLEPNFWIIYYDQRGCGRSEEPANNSYSIDTLTNDLDKIRQAFQVQQIIPLGYSFGATLAVEYALRYKQHVQALILQALPIWGHSGDLIQLSGFYKVLPDSKRAILDSLDKSAIPTGEVLAKAWSLATSDEVDQFLFVNDSIAKMNRRLWKSVSFRNTGKMAKALSKEVRPTPLLKEFEKIDCKTLLLSGVHDNNGGLHGALYYHQHNPKSQLVLFEKSAHFPDMEEPNKYAMSIKQFIQKLK